MSTEVDAAPTSERRAGFMGNEDASTISRRLAAALPGQSPDRMIDVLVRTTPVQMPSTGARSERVSQAREDYDRMIGPLSEQIIDAGGEVLDRAWLSATLRVRLPVRSIDAVAAHGSVVAIDLPTVLAPEADSR